MRIKSFVIGLVPLFMTAVLVAGCGGGGQSGATQEQGGSTSQQKGATVAVTKNSELEEILVDDSGQTLYLFTADEKNNSSCSNACAGVWPPLTTQGAPTAGQGASADKLGTISRESGDTQVTYNGHPLYYYAPDKQPGDIKGQELDQFGAEWYVVSPSGNKVEEGEGGDSSGGSGGGSGESEGGGY